METPTFRCFIAIRLPEATKKWLKHLQKNVRKTGVQASWPKAETLHLTLKFLGQVPASRLSLVKACMSNVARQVPSFFLNTSGMGVFPSVKKSRVFWAGIQGQTDRLETLVSGLDACLTDQAGMKPDKKRFSPHVTFARIKQNVSPSHTIALIQSFEGQSAEPFDVVKIYLFKSILQPDGAKHEVLFSAPLLPQDKDGPSAGMA